MGPGAFIGYSQQTENIVSQVWALIRRSFLVSNAILANIHFTDGDL